MEYDFSYLEKLGDQKKPTTSSRLDFLAGLHTGQEVQEREEKRLAALRKAQEAKRRKNTSNNGDEAL